MRLQPEPLDLADDVLDFLGRGPFFHHDDHGNDSFSANRACTSTWAGCDWRTIKQAEGGSKWISPGPPASLQVAAAARLLIRSTSADADWPLRKQAADGIKFQFQPGVQPPCAC